MTANKTSFQHGNKHPRWAGNSEPDLAGKTFGNLTVVSDKVQRRNGSRYILCTCSLTDKTEWVSRSNVLSGKTKSLTKNGKVFSQVNKTLGKRYDAIVARCGSPNYKSYKDYGGRGIKNNFENRRSFVDWVKANLPHDDYKGLEIDRVDNNGHYEPGNLRLVTRKENLRNCRNTVYITFRGQKVLIENFNSPYGPTPTARYARLGLTGEQIISNAELAVAEKRKNWRGILKRLQEITNPQPPSYKGDLP
jgi:hypothetical protein